MIRPVGTMSAKDVDMRIVRELAQENSPVILRGFQNTRDCELFVKKAEELGTPMPWNFGLILEVKDQGSDTQGLNNVFSSEWMPLHYDGLFRIQKSRDIDGKEYVRSCPPPSKYSLHPDPRIAEN